jgi:hypothetical protein
VTVPRRRSARVTARVAFGDVDLALFSGTARSTVDRARRVRVSRKRGKATEALTIRNRTGRSRTYYLHLQVASAARTLDAGYLLTVRRP